MHRQGGEKINGLDEVIGAGACALDFDADGWTDLFVVGGSGQSRYYGRSEWWQIPHGNVLYRNLGGRFVDVTLDAGIQSSGWGMGCVAADLDNDGDQDLFLTQMGRNTLLRNNGDGSFSDATAESGIDGDLWSTSATVADYDGDGLLDIYVVNYLRYHKSYRTYETLSEFRSDLAPQFDSQLYDSAPNQLLRNLGHLRFRDVTRSVGLEDASGRGLAAIWSDLNDDGRPDLLVANDAGTPNVVFINQGKGVFDSQAQALGLNVAEGTAGVTSGDIDNDGDVDVIVSSGAGLPPRLFINGDSGMLARSPTAREPKKLGTTRFRDGARELGAGDESTAAFHGWGVEVADLNNDGWLDVLFANGLLTPDRLAPRLPQGQPNQLWTNPGASYRFGQAAPVPVSLPGRASGRGMVLADFDNDGDVDTYLTHNNGLGQLLTNQSLPRHWLGISLQGSDSNRDGIGARVVVEAGGQQQLRESGPANSFLSSSDRRIHFGLGDQDSVQRLTVHWPDGTRTVIDDPPIDRYLLIRQNQADAEALHLPGIAPPGELRLALGEHSPDLRMRYLELLGNSNRTDIVLAELAAALDDPSQQVRLRAVELLGEMRDASVLALLTQATDDSSPVVRVAAIRALYPYEEETATRWLIHALQDPAWQVRCAAAEAFGFYFREEEAVVIQKYLAVPGLIRMLDAEQAQARECAAQALGDAEHFRAVEPIISLLDDKSTAVRIEAAKALGLIRHQAPVPALRKVLMDMNQAPSVRAQSLIALKRLNALPLDDELGGLLDFPDDTRMTQYASGALRTLLEVVRNPGDGVVIAPRLISDRVLSWYRHLPQQALNTPQWTLSINTALDIFLSVRESKSVALAEQLSTHADARIRAKAWDILVSLDRSRASAHAAQGLADSDAGVRATVLDSLAASDAQLTSAQLSPALSDPLLLARALPLLARIPGAEAQQQTLQAFEFARPARNAPTAEDVELTDARLDAIRLAALETWRQLNTKHRFTAMPEILSGALSDPSPAVRGAALVVLAERDERWAMQGLRARLGDAREPSPIRSVGVLALGRKATAGAGEILYRLAQLRHDPTSDTALAQLTTEGNDRNRRFLWRVLNNPHERPGARMAAAAILIDSEPEQVISALWRDIWSNNG